MYMYVRLLCVYMYSTCYIFWKLISGKPKNTEWLSMEAYTYTLWLSTHSQQVFQQNIHVQCTCIFIHMYIHVYMYYALDGLKIENHCTCTCTYNTFD